MSVDEQWGDLLAYPVESPERFSRSDQEGDVGADDLEPELPESQTQLEYESYASTSLTIPGTGEPGPHCGEYGPMRFCDECGEVAFGQERCERRSCPNCDHLWERQRTIGGVQRLAKARYAEEDGIDRRVVHAFASPEPGEIKTLVQWYSAYQDAYELAQEAGIRGGVVIGHGFRIKDEAESKYRNDDDAKDGVWRYIQRDLPKPWYRYTYWSPHFHIIGLCRDLEPNKPDEQGGWNLERIRSLRPFTSTTDREGVEDMIGNFRYILDHGTYEPGTSKDCVRWFGTLATSKFTASEHLSSGAEDAIERLVEEAVGQPNWDDEESSEDARDQNDGDEACLRCGSTSLSSIFDAGTALMDKNWCEEIGRDQQRKLSTAFEWAIGEVVPPPGLRKPQSEEEAREALEELLD